MGRRLGELTNDNTKCMLEVNGTRLINRTLDALSDIGISRVVLVVGYKAENVKRWLGDRYKDIDIVYVENSVYDKTNNIYSLFLAKEHLVEDDTLLLESDLIFEPSVLRRIVEEPYPNLALVDKYESWMDGTVVTLDEEQRIKSFISKDKFRYSDIESYFKTVNIYKFSKDFAQTHYVPFLEAYCHALGRNEYYEQVLKVITLLDDSPLRALPLCGEKWYEIDDIQDLDIASSIFACSDEERYRSIASRFGGYWRYPHMLDFCYLVNPYFPPQQMVDEIKASFDTLLREYPSGMRVNSLLAAKYFGVAQEHIVVGNGAAELIKLYMENHAGKMGIVFPTFEEYPNRVSKEDVVAYLPASDTMQYSAEDIKRFFADKNIESLLIINPDNPSGNYIAYNDLLGLIVWAKERGISLIVDESFVDFVDVEGEFSLLHDDILARNPHLCVVKSISKSYGVPGFRLGVLASGNKALIAGMKKEVAIWNINSFGEFYMQIFGKYEKDYMAACHRFIAERNRFGKLLQQIPYLRVLPTQANFFCCQVTDRYSSAELTKQLLSRFNIMIKDCDSKNGLKGRNFIRLSVRATEDNDRLIEAFHILAQ